MRSDGILEADMEDDDKYAFVRRYKMTNNEETNFGQRRDEDGRREKNHHIHLIHWDYLVHII